MKNRLIIFLSLFILLGCSSQKNTTSYSKKQYNEYVSYYNRLKMSTSFDESCDDCSIQLITNKISNKKIRYDIIINNPVIEMKNIKASLIILIRRMVIIKASIYQEQHQKINLMLSSI